MKITIQTKDTVVTKWQEQDEVPIEQIVEDLFKPCLSAMGYPSDVVEQIRIKRED